MTDISAALYTEKVGRTKGFCKSVCQSLHYELPELFNDAYEVFSEFLSRPELNLSIQEKHLEILQAIDRELFCFFKTKKFKQEKALEYLEVIGDVIPPKVFAFLLWTQDQKDACIKILEHNEITLSEKEYDSLYLIVMPHRENNNVPYQEKARFDYLEKQKEDFFLISNKFKLAKELTSSLTISNEVKKKPKI